MISREAFLQDVGVLEQMYQAAAGLRQSSSTRHPHWTAVMLEGPLDQIAETEREVHEVLGIRDRIDATPAVAADPIPSVGSAAEFDIVLEGLLRLYRVLGACRYEASHYYPSLYRRLVQEALPQLVAVRNTLRGYLRIDEHEQTLAELAKMAESASAVPSEPSSAPLSPDEVRP